MASELAIANDFLTKKGETEMNLDLTRLIEELPFYGVRQMTSICVMKITVCMRNAFAALCNLWA